MARILETVLMSLQLLFVTPCKACTATKRALRSFVDYNSFLPLEQHINVYSSRHIAAQIHNENFRFIRLPSCEDRMSKGPGIQGQGKQGCTYSFYC